MKNKTGFSPKKAFAVLSAVVLSIALHMGPGYSQVDLNSAVFGTVSLAKGQVARLHFVNLNPGPLGSLKATLKFFDMTGTVLTQHQWLVMGGEHVSLDWYPPVAQQIRAIVSVSAEGSEALTDLFLADLEVLLSKNGPADRVISPISLTVGVNSGCAEEAKRYAEQAEASAAVADSAARNAEMAAADSKASADKAEAAADRAEAAAAKAEACLMKI